MRMRGVAGLVLLGLVAAGCEEAEFGPSQARALLPAAAAMSGETFDMIVSLGAKLTPTDIVEGGGASLTAAVLAYEPVDARRASAEDRAKPAELVFEWGPRTTPTDLATAMRPQVERDGKRVPKDDVACLLRDEYLREVTCVRTGDTASGTASFEAPGAYRGRVTWRAARGPKGWRIVEFRFPVNRFRVFLDGETWKAEDELGPLRSPKEWSLLHTSELVRAGTVADHPEDAVFVTLTADGGIHVKGSVVDLRGLAIELQALTLDPREREPDGSSKRHVVLRVHPALPWEVVAWTMGVCASPRIRIYRLHFAVQSEVDGLEGSIETALPRDRGVSSKPAVLQPEDARHLRIGLLAHEHAVDRAEMFAALRAALDKVGGPGGSRVTLSNPLPKRVAAGHMIGMVDLLLRAGVTRVDFEGSPLPPGIHSAGDWGVAPGESNPPAPGDGRTWVQRYVAEHPLPAKGYSVRLGDVDRLVGDGKPSGLALPPPPARRVRGAKPGPLLATAPEDEALPEESEEINPGDVGTDGDMDVPEVPLEEEAIPDAPLEGPSGGKQRPKPRAADAKVEWTFAALRWLAAHQSDDGGWSAEGFGAWCDGKPNTEAPAGGPGRAAYDVGVTALAVSAFLGAGYTNRGDHEFARIVRKGLAFLKNRQGADGCFGNASDTRDLALHGMATLALVEAYGMTLSPIFKGAAMKAVECLVASRARLLPADLAQGQAPNLVAWSALALASARLVDRDAVLRGRPAPFALAPQALEDFRAWLERRAGADDAEAAGAAALFGLLGADGTAPISELVKARVALLRRTAPRWPESRTGTSFMGLQFAALALFQTGGEAWTACEENLHAALTLNQSVRGTVCGPLGSVDPEGFWGQEGGRVASTALFALCLEAEDRYPRNPALTPNK